MDAVVMAAGEGTRLRPLTERFAKPVLPIDGKPVIASLLRELAAAGVTRAAVVVGHLAEQVERLVGDGSAFGLEVVYAQQPEALGSADAVRRGLATGVGPPLLVTAADTAYTPGDVARFWSAFAAGGAAGAIAVRTDPPPGPGKPNVRFDESGRIERVVDHDAGNPYGSAPLWGVAPALVPYFEDLSGPPFEVSEAAQRAVDSGETLVAIEIGPTRDLTHPVDLVEENFPYLGSTL